MSTESILSPANILKLRMAATEVLAVSAIYGAKAGNGITVLWGPASTLASIGSYIHGLANDAKNGALRHRGAIRALQDEIDRCVEAPARYTFPQKGFLGFDGTGARIAAALTKAIEALATADN